MINTTQTKANAPVVNKAMPEFIQRKDTPARPWVVQEGQPLRGEAWTDMVGRVMRVPFGDDETSRVIRAHELTHAKVSPSSPEIMTALIAEKKLDFQCTITAEEFRVNMLVAHAGFDVSVLADGSESRSGKLAGQNNDWNGMIRYLGAVAGTKGATDFIRGLRSSNPEMAKSASEVQKQIKKLWKNITRRGIAKTADTAPHPCGLPKGFLLATVPLAELLTKLLIADDNYQRDDSTPPSASEVRGRLNGRNGTFANLLELPVSKPRAVDGKYGRKRVAANVGKNPRRIDRMLIDPERRIFDRHVKGKGGVILIDQSGSMHLDEKDIWDIIKYAPGCVIIGYSHRSASVDVPNVWVIADRGKVADRIPDGNGGNGVDGPAVRFAVSKRRKGEPLIWVCDGYVTDGEADNVYQNLDEECVNLVVKHDIHMVENVEGAINALKKASQGGKLPTVGVGQLASGVRAKVALR
jgi:hypothetical protein